MRAFWNTLDGMSELVQFLQPQDSSGDGDGVSAKCELGCEKSVEEIESKLERYTASWEGKLDALREEIIALNVNHSIRTNQTCKLAHL